MTQEDFAQTPAGQAALAASMAASGGNREIVPPDLLTYLQATGLDQTPMWRRVLSGQNPVGGATSYGWEGADTPVRTRTQIQDRVDPGMDLYDTTQTEQVYDPESGSFIDRPRFAGTSDPMTVRTRTEVPVTANGQNVMEVRAPIYFEGDGDVEYSKMTNEQRAWAKQMMRDSGLLAPNAGGIGSMWDGQAFNAFNEVLRYSNAKGVSWRSSMSSMRDYLTAHPEEKVGPKGATLPAFTPNVANPADLRKVFEQAATKFAGGKGVDPAAVDRYVQAYQQEQVRSQQQAYSATYSPGETGVGPGGTVVNAPSPDVYAEEMLRKENPAATGAADISNVMGNLMNILGGAGG